MSSKTGSTQWFQSRPTPRVQTGSGDKLELVVTQQVERAQRQEGRCLGLGCHQCKVEYRKWSQRLGRDASRGNSTQNHALSGCPYLIRLSFPFSAVKLGESAQVQPVIHHDEARSTTTRF